MAAIAERPFVGLECTLYYNTGTRITPVLVEIVRAINVSATCTTGEAEIASRQTRWKYKRATLKELEITFTYQKKAGTDTVFDYLQAAAMADPPTIIDLWMLDGTSVEVGAQGFRMFAQLFGLNLGQDLENVEEVEFTAKATHQESATPVAPDWYEVPA
jgi:hypothetical protein